MSKVIKIKKGLNIKLKGSAEKVLEKTEQASKFAIKPTDFQNLTPKLTVKIDDEVKAGSPLFFDKYQPEVLFTSPVSGKVSAINRGERRKILEVVVDATSSIEYEDFGKADPETLSEEQIKEKLLKSGTWSLIIQRPYGVVANPKSSPKAIYISGFDSAPLAPDFDFSLQGEEKNLQSGIDVLNKLTEGKVHLSLNAEYPTTGIFKDLKNVEYHHFTGPHPAGNVGIQIHNICPINKDDVVWTVSPNEVVIIGRLFNEGKYDAHKVIALAGSEVKNPRYYKVIAGTSISNLVKDHVENNNVRFISGNVLTGTKVEKNGYLGSFSNMVTVIPEGDFYEFFGWIAPGFKKFSAAKSYPTYLFPKKQYKLHTNLNGGKRAFVFSGEYEKVLPMDILPVHLLKSILVDDIDKMEQLGIYEIIEEDLALCEFVCTSKIEVQSILRNGINSMIKELGI
jgi:Na+-transporting NADH:ubiquinone oxidoreductase subunit A